MCIYIRVCARTSVISNSSCQSLHRRSVKELWLTWNWRYGEHPARNTNPATLPRGKAELLRSRCRGCNRKRRSKLESNNNKKQPCFWPLEFNIYFELERNHWEDVFFKQLCNDENLSSLFAFSYFSITYWLKQENDCQRGRELKILEIWGLWEKILVLIQKFSQSTQYSEYPKVSSKSVYKNTKNK